PANGVYSAILFIIGSFVLATRMYICSSYIQHYRRRKLLIQYRQTMKIVVCK
uniref:Uncharacterized protein n=1 Tax=Aegilops tauschii subsp. strangulata TaxID=200361 RepID=A0A453SM55_AEGTS